MRCKRKTDRRSIAKRFFESPWQQKGLVLTRLVSGASMGATLVDGMRVKVRFEAPPQPQRNRIVCIRRDGKIVIHWLLGCFGRWCVEKGDGNRYPGFCRRRDIIGVFLGMPEQDDVREDAEQ